MARQPSLRTICQRLAGALEAVCTVHQTRDMGAAVTVAAELAERGDTVLLSPACASLDMYESFAARGEDFGARVREVLS